MNQDHRALPKLSLLTICGLAELGGHGSRAVTHVLSILDPDWPEPNDFEAYGAHHRTTLRFHDVIEPGGGLVLPTREHVEAILNFGRGMQEADAKTDLHLLVHCHMGISRSTAAMATLLAQATPDESEDRIFERLAATRPQAWPNSRMIGFADELLGRRGRFTAALSRHYAQQLVRSPEIAVFMQANSRSREIDMAAAAGRSDGMV